MRYKFLADHPVLVVDLNGTVLQPGQEFDPAEFGVPDFVPEPDPHPYFARLDKPSPKKPEPQPPQE